MCKSLIMYTVFMLQIPVLVRAEAPDLKDLLVQYKSSSDTARVLLLLRIDSLYLYIMPDKEDILDSALLLARQAKILSASIHFRRGYETAFFMEANSLAEKGDMSAAADLANSAKGALQVRLLIMMGERYLFRPGELPQNLDSAYRFIMSAKAMSDSLHSTLLIYNSLALLGKYYFSRGQFMHGKDCFMKIIADCHRTGQVGEEAHWWNELGTYMPDTDSTYAEETNAFHNAYHLYRRINDERNESDVLRNIAYVHQRHKQLDLAESEYLEAIAIRRSLGIKKFWSEYLSLANINLSKGNYNKTLYYALAAVGNSDSLGEVNMAGVIDYHLGYAYRELDEVDKSMHWYKKALDQLAGYRDHYLFPICRGIVTGLLRAGKAHEAYAYLEVFVGEHPPLRFVDRETVAACRGDCFNALGEYDLAEENYLQMIALDDRAHEHLKDEIVSDYLAKSIMGSEAYYAIGRFYVEHRHYKKAGHYLTTALAIDDLSPPLSRLKDIHLMLFKVDSAEGNYLAAIRHFEIHKLLDDSIFNDTKNKQIEALQIQYETDKKEKDLQVVRATSQLQAKELERAAQTRNFIYFMGVVLIVLLGVGFSRYRIKQKSNYRLLAQQKEINAQYQSLKVLNTAQEKLLAEKEWLVKEIHHRVKNNLQIIISLLNAQSEFTDNPLTLGAIQESRERMQAIAIIHQKLYQQNGTTLINMPSYVQEMVACLDTSFTGSGSIFFQLDIADIDLDVAQVVPLGLIMNEAITNAVKYAFRGSKKGIISISLEPINDRDITLKIADNGQGFPKDFDISTNNTMGIQLMKLFTEQLEGELHFLNADGVEISLTFRVHRTSNPSYSPQTADRTNEKNINC